MLCINKVENVSGPMPTCSDPEVAAHIREFAYTFHITDLTGLSAVVQSHEVQQAVYALIWAAYVGDDFSHYETWKAAQQTFTAQRGGQAASTPRDTYGIHPLKETNYGENPKVSKPTSLILSFFEAAERVRADLGVGSFGTPAYVFRIYFRVLMWYLGTEQEWEWKMYMGMTCGATTTGKEKDGFWAVHSVNPFFEDEEWMSAIGELAGWVGEHSRWLFPVRELDFDEGDSAV